MANTTLTVDIEYDPEVTHPDGLASAMDRLLETVLSTPGIMDEYGDPQFRCVLRDGGWSGRRPGPTVVVVEIAGGVLQEAYSSDQSRPTRCSSIRTRRSRPRRRFGIIAEPPMRMAIPGLSASRSSPPTSD